MNWKFCTLTAIINGRELKYDMETNEIWGIHLKSNKWKVKSLWTHYGYLKIKIGNKGYSHHRVIYKFYNPEWNIDDYSKDNSIDHISGHTDDNRIENLRNVNHQKNHFNETKAKGYRWQEKLQKWHAYITLNGKQIHLGYFVLEADARNAYLAAKLIYHII